MPAQRVAGILEFPGARGFGHPARNFVHAAIADKCCRARQCKPVVADERAAEFAVAIMLATGLPNRLACDLQRMSREANALPGSFKQLLGNVAWIGPANGSSALVDLGGESKRLHRRLVEHRM